MEIQSNSLSARHAMQLTGDKFLTRCPMTDQRRVPGAAPPRNSGVVGSVSGQSALLVDPETPTSRITVDIGRAYR